MAQVLDITTKIHKDRNEESDEFNWWVFNLGLWDLNVLMKIQQIDCWESEGFEESEKWKICYNIDIRGDAPLLNSIGNDRRSITLKERVYSLEQKQDYLQPLKLGSIVIAKGNLDVDSADKGKGLILHSPVIEILPAQHERIARAKYFETEINEGDASNE